MFQKRSSVYENEASKVRSIPMIVCNFCATRLGWTNSGLAVLFRSISWHYLLLLIAFQLYFYLDCSDTVNMLPTWPLENQVDSGSFTDLTGVVQREILVDEKLIDEAEKSIVHEQDGTSTELDYQKLVFHYIFTQKQNTAATFRWTGPFSFLNRRSLESTLFHHPNATIIFHTNDLPENFFDDLTVQGYDIRVRRYGALETLLADTPARDFIPHIPKAMESPHWYSHVTDLLRFVFLYKYGGVYFDTDVIATRPMEKLLKEQNVNAQTALVAWTPRDDIIVEHRPLMNCAVLVAPAQHPYLKSCLEEFARTYDGNCWACNGPFLITNVFEAKQWEDAENYPVIDLEAAHWWPISVYGAHEMFLRDTATYQGEFAHCANEGEMCWCVGGVVNYGKSPNWAGPQPISQRIECSAATFGDPIKSEVKTCECKVDGSTRYWQNLEKVKSSTTVHMFGSVVGKNAQKKEDIIPGTIAEFLLTSFTLSSK